MNKAQLLVGVCTVSFLCIRSAGAQEPPKPGPEQAALQKLVGTWDATVKTPGGESKGTMTYKMQHGGFWLVSDFKGEFGGMKFEGNGLDGYDPVKKKYVGIWTDSMAPTPLITEGNYDKDAKVLTMTGEGPGPDGKPTRYKLQSEMKDDDTMTMTMFMPDKDGKNQEMMTITYKRKK